MTINCGYCKDTIKQCGLSYRGFDSWFCSPTCRVKMWTKIYQIDSNFNNHEKWYDKKDDKKWSIQDLKKYDIEMPKEKSDSEETLICSEVSYSSQDSNPKLVKTKTIKSEIDLENGLKDMYTPSDVYEEFNDEKRVCNIIIDNMTDRVINNIMFIDISNSVKYAYNSIASYLK